MHGQFKQMNNYSILIENLKCASCMHSIRTALMKLKGITSIEILQADSKVIVSGDAIDKDTVLATLTALGYPQKGSNTFKSKAKSFVSCALGKLDTINKNNYEKDTI